MIYKEAEQFLDSYLHELVSTIGFERLSPLIYSRQIGEATAYLAFPCRCDGQGVLYFGCNVWLRFESVEEFLRSSSTTEIIPTISIPLHLLGESQQFKEWRFSKPEDLEFLKDEIMEDLVSHAVPFVERYSNLSDVCHRLQSPNPKDWFVLSPGQRLNIIAVIQFVQGNYSESLRILDVALSERQLSLPKSRQPIELVRKRLAEATMSKCTPLQN